MTGRYADFAPKDRGQVALVSEAHCLCDQSQRLIGSAHQSFCPLDSRVHDVTLRPHANPATRSRAAAGGALGLIEKPHRACDLLALVRRALGIGP